VRNLSLVFILYVGVSMLGVDMPLEAQDTATKIDRIERQLRAVQRRVFGTNGGNIDDAQQEFGNSAQPVQQNNNTARIVADMSVKISSVEKQLRILTGRLEELEYRQRQLEEALEAVQKDTDLKINDLKQSSLSSGASVSNTASNRPNNAGQQPANPEPASPKIELPVGEPGVQYDYAFSLIRKNDLDSGLIAMEKFLVANPGDSRSGNAKYWLGRIHFLQKRPGQAAQSFLKLIEEHPNHPRRPDALVDLAETLINLDSATDACNALAEFDRSASGVSSRLRDRAGRVASRANCG
jgi:TolA-binding protein